MTSLSHLLESLPDDATCRTYLEQVRWPAGPVCPHCGVIDPKHYKLKRNNLYKCKECKAVFSVLVGTMFEGSHVPLRKWFIALYIFCSHKKGISSYQLASDFGLTQKTAWYMLSRMRSIFFDKHIEPLTGEVEIDETYMGGKERNRHKKKRKNIDGYTGKVPVMGLLQRQGKIVIHVLKEGESKGAFIKPIVRNVVSKDATIITDGFGAYSNLHKEFLEHQIVDHQSEEYVRGPWHTNSIEGFWSLMKRGIYGIYHHTSHKHLGKYCNEFSFRFNLRKLNNHDRFDMALKAVDNGRLMYKDLIKEV